MEWLGVHSNGRSLMKIDKNHNCTPFFYLGDTAWDIFQKLSKEETEYYFSVRAKQGFTVLQCILFAGSEPIDWPNKYGRCSIKAPFQSIQPDTDGDYSYWDHIDWCLSCAEKYGLYLALLPMWNNKYNDPETTLFRGYAPSYSYGKFLGERYQSRPNIIWMLGGDVDVQPYMHEIFRGVADGIRDGEGEKKHLITFHPGGLSTSVGQLQGDQEYLDFHTCQSGHTVQAYCPQRFFPEMAATGKPFLDAEPHYEDHVANWVGSFRRWTGDDIREGAYESVFSGACGVTYGNPLTAFALYEPLVQWERDYYIGDLAEGGWMEALRHQGAECLQHLKNLCLSRPFFEYQPAPQLVLNSKDDLLFGNILAVKGESFAFVYSPLGREIQVDMEKIFDKPFVRAAWYNPRTGEEKEICYCSPRKAVFVPETHGQGQDWVLILDNFVHAWKEIGEPIHK